MQRHNATAICASDTHIVYTGVAAALLCSPRPPLIISPPSSRPTDNIMRIGRPLDPPIVAPPSSTLFTHSLKSLGFSKSHFGGTGTGTAMGLGSVGGAFGLGSVGSMGFGSGGEGAFGPNPAAGGGTGLGSSSLVGTMGKGQGPRSLAMRGRDWQQSEWLRTRTEQYARYERGRRQYTLSH